VCVCVCVCCECVCTRNLWAEGSWVGPWSPNSELWGVYDQVLYVYLCGRRGVCVCECVNVCVLGICGQKARGLVPDRPTASCGVFMIWFRMCISVGGVLCVRACPCVCVCVCVCVYLESVGKGLVGWSLIKGLVGWSLIAQQRVVGWL